ncbi:MAG: TIGR03663 family protein [Caldilineaceae bacterium SB0661_bin_32]|uniref:TIGR03663 family protein n=1 Tax=Caldilineaceae bacterium SB0661_bin_32 TaxID=2605255 RepID=A0A6B1DBH8_9CHLR|nr:TIGR03663 family protein [Caldilineaceae bacterium SB0661_bin_32]
MAEGQGENEVEAQNEVSEKDVQESAIDTSFAGEQEESSGKALPDRAPEGPLQTEAVLPSAGFLDANLLTVFRANWETVAWAVILIAAVVSRFYELGVRGMSHDESLHANYSLDLYRSGSYQHNPMMHGPFLFHANAFIYFLFGVSDATARFMPALAGIGTVMAAWLSRRWIGRTGALLTALIFLFSPSILFHSRYIRNDIYIVFFSMIWIYFMFRYFEDRKLKWLYYTVTVMAFGFAAKENQFMSGTIFGVFMVGAALWRWWTGKEQLQNSSFADMAVLLLTLVLPFVAPLGHLIIGWDALAYSSALDLTRSAILVLLMTGLSAAIAFWWFGPAQSNENGTGSGSGNGQERRITFATWATLMGLFWAIEILLFTTFFTNPVDGLATGVVGSLGYWLAQQEVQRGGQPWYYYIMQSLLYEFLPLFLSLGGLTLLVHRLRTGSWGSPATEDGASSKAKGRGGGDSGLSESESTQGTSWVRPYFVLFLAWWGVGAWLSYSYAGEKMPWLTTHMTQPMAMFGGWWGGQILQRIDWKKVRDTQGWWLLALLPALLFVLATLAGSIPTGGRDVDTLSRTVRFILALGLTGALLYYVYFTFLRSGWRLTLRLTAVTAFTILFLLTIRFSFLLTYVNYDMATEYLVYAHASPDVKRALQEIETISERTVGEREIQVSYDDDVAWPMTWYMRFYPNHIFYGANPTTEAMNAPIILVGKKNYEKVEPYVGRDYVSRNYRLVWWPEESYKSSFDEEGSEIPLFDRIWGALTDRERRSGLWQIFFFRNHPDRTLTEWPHRHDFRMYIHRDIADIVWDLNVVPTAGGGPFQPQSFNYEELDRSASIAYNGLYDASALANPRSIAIGADGLRYILDTGNNRVVVLNADGSFRLAFGSTCFLAEGESGDCIDPDGAGPLDVGDGQFREPWGIAVDAGGTIFVADTWNGRIQAFDSEGNFLRKWGAFSIVTEENRDPYALFGPRGLAVTPAGNLLVADTGNKRILEFSPVGEFIRQIGGGGIILGHFEEPVDIAIHPPTGNVLVSDAWNRRIQVLSADFVPLYEWLIPTWESQDIWDKPYIAAAADGTVYATDPQFAQVYVISSGGVVQSSFGRYGEDLNRFAKPTGIAIDPLTGEILVADADNHRVLVFAGN